MKLFLNLIIECFCIGILVLFAGLIIEYVYQKTHIKCETYKKYIILFFSGVLVHLFCELTGINVWYLKNSYAFMKYKKS